MSKYDKEALKLHKENKGKLEVKSKVPIRNKEDLSLAYTPGVAEVSRVVAKDPKQARELTGKGNAVAVVSDGSAVLGLGNIGPLGALSVMEGKAIIFKEFAGVDAYPIVLDTQDTEEIIKTVKNIAPGFSGINLEDISAPRCFEVERRLKEELDIPVFHDDQHGTAIVVLAGLINALKVVNKKIEDIKILINGAGAAGHSIANLLSSAGVGSLVVLDSRGVISVDRSYDIPEHKKELLKLPNYREYGNRLEDAIIGQDVFIGISAKGVLFPEMVGKMAKDPIVFAMANPDPEIMPKLAKEAGARVIATGRSDFLNQVNNALAFPGIFRGLLDHNIKNITTEMKIAVAQAIASLEPNPTAEKILPDVFDQRVVPAIVKSLEKFKDA